MNLYSSIIDKKKAGKKQIAILIDPDKPSDDEIIKIAHEATKAQVDYFFIGGSLLTTDTLNNCIKLLKNNSYIPTILFPGNTLQMTGKADAILFLSLISGRNAEMLIGRHVVSAPYIKLTGLEVISTGYMLIDSGTPTSVSYMSNSNPIPNDKVDIAACTAMAGEMLGLKMIFMDAGSGAINSVSEKMINTVSQSIDIPLIIGGGIKTPFDAEKKVKAGADLIVVGNSIEKDSSLITEMANAVHSV